MKGYGGFPAAGSPLHDKRIPHIRTDHPVLFSLNGGDNIFQAIVGIGSEVGLQKRIVCGDIDILNIQQFPLFNGELPFQAEITADRSFRAMIFRFSQPLFIIQIGDGSTPVHNNDLLILFPDQGSLADIDFFQMAGTVFAEIDTGKIGLFPGRGKILQPLSHSVLKHGVDHHCDIVFTVCGIKVHHCFLNGLIHLCLFAHLRQDGLIDILNGMIQSVLLLMVIRMFFCIH